MTTYQLKFWMIVVVTIIFGSVNGQTNVNGGIYANTTWTKANSPYIANSVVVFPNVTLTIEPGVVIMVTGGMEIRQSTVIAEGTSTDSIIFIGDTTSNDITLWLNNALSSKIGYCSFRNGSTGLYVRLNSDSLTIRNSIFINNGTALYDINGAILIDSCLFKNNSVGINQARVTVTNSIFRKNQNAMLIVTHSTIQNCTIDSNTVVGIEPWSYNLITSCEIKNNGIGLDCRSGGSYNSNIYNNIIENNNIGIQLSNNFGPDSIYCNSICNNITYNVKATTPHNRIVAKNYWCTSDSNLIANSIYDGYDNASLGIVNFMPIDTVPCYQSGCNLFVSTYIVTSIRCFGDSGSVKAVITGGTPPYNLLWNDGQSTDTAIGLLAGTYTATVTDSSGCTASRSVTIQNGTRLHVSTTVTNATCDTCRNGSATVYVTNGSTPITYTWNSSPLQTSQTAHGLSWGTYIVCAVDDNGCTICDTVFIDSTNCTGYSVLAQSKSSSCSSCNDGKAWTNIIGGTPPYSFTWYTSPIQTADTAIGLLQGTYVVCVNDLYGCTVCDTVTVSIGNCSAFFDLYLDTIPHYYYAVNRASGSLPLTYSWDWGDGSFDTIPFPNHTYSAAGFYTICLSITDSTGCTDTHCTSYYLLKTSNEIIQVNVVPELPTGIFENSNTETVLIYPNPAFDIVTIELSKQNSGTDIRLFNTLGQLELSSRTINQKTNLDISGLTSGVYVLELRTDKTMNRQKFIKE